ncbi:MAG: HlyD family type I secretion periplasmic adaptor subunit [Amphritea sp.]|nr:HlyD family type I secretion periplasmic adaptor subunit [Amphritea sp.]
MKQAPEYLFDSGSSNAESDTQRSVSYLSRVKRLVSQKNNLKYEFLPEYLEVLEKPPSSVARYFVFAIMVLVFITLLWATLGRIDIIASAEGRLIIDHRSKVIQAPDMGEISDIYVRDGQKVSQGQLLISLNPTEAIAEHQRLKNQLSAVQLDLARVEALLSDDPLGHFMPPDGAGVEKVRMTREVLAADFHSFDAQVDQLTGQIKENKHQQRLLQNVSHETELLIHNARERLKARKKLLDQGHFTRLGYLELEKELIQETRDDARQRSTVAQLASEGQKLVRQLAQLRTDHRQKLLERRTTLNTEQIDLTKQLVSAAERLRKMNIVAPVAGVVQQQVVHTVGGVVQPAQELMIIVPEDANLEAEVTVLNRDVGFIRAGQTVEVKIDSFPYTKHGTIKGEVVHVSLDSMQDERRGLVYPARIRLARQVIAVGSREVPLSAGMSVVAEIKTGDRKVIDYLLSPLKEYQSESLKER